MEIRPATPADRSHLERLAVLDDKRAPDGAVLVAIVDGELVVALPLDGGSAIADPFRPTAGVVRLLELHAESIREAVRAPRRHLLARLRRT